MLVDWKGAIAYRPLLSSRLPRPQLWLQVYPKLLTVAEEFMFDDGKDDFSKSSQSLLQTIHLSYHQSRQEASDFDIASSWKSPHGYLCHDGSTTGNSLVSLQFANNERCVEAKCCTCIHFRRLRVQPTDFVLYRMLTL